MKEAWIIDAVRTPRGKGRKDKGALAGIHPQELFAQCLKGLQTRNDFDPAWVEDVVGGCVSQVSEQGANITRNAVLAADWPEVVTGVTLNRFCGSGLQAVNFAAMGVMSGQQNLAVGGGVESMSRVPMASDGAGMDGNNLRLRDKIYQVPQGISADLIATLEKFSREELDAYAVKSQNLAEKAQKEGYFKSIIPVKDPESGAIALEADEHPRHGTTMESMGGLKTVFDGMGAAPSGVGDKTLDQIALDRYPEAGSAINHVHTAGNASGIVDGAAAVLLAADDFAKEKGLKPRARIKAVATYGAEPLIMLTAPAPASERALKKAGMSVGDIDLWEINEAFAAIPLQTIRKLGIDPERVNVNGGAIALGHPLGATGAVLLGTVLDELERRDLSTGLVTLCIGGGMGIATIIERI